jgi:hypothetical protein
MVDIGFNRVHYTGKVGSKCKNHLWLPKDYLRHRPMAIERLPAAPKKRQQSKIQFLGATYGVIVA